MRVPVQQAQGAVAARVGPEGAEGHEVVTAEEQGAGAGPEPGRNAFLHGGKGFQ